MSVKGLERLLTMPVTMPEQSTLFDLTSLSTDPIAVDVSADNLIVHAKFAKHNKQGTVREYRAQINKRYPIADSDYPNYYVEKCKVTHTVYLPEQAYDLFAENLLEDRDWLKGKGGHESNDPALPADGSNFFDWTEEQQKLFRRTCYRLVVAVVANNRDTLYIDPQGHSYARYVGL